MIRSDYRLPDQLRDCQILTQYNPYAEGSCLIKMGHTHVLCTASVLKKVPPFLKDPGQGWLTAEYGMLPRATHSRSDREASKGKQSGRTQEIQRLIGRAMRQAIDLNDIPGLTIQLDCDVLQADGGTRCASITGASVALNLAIRQLVADGVLASMPPIKPISAVSVGIVDGEVLLDLNYVEDSRCETDMNVVMTHQSQFVEIQGTAEGKPFDETALAQLLRLAKDGNATLQQLQQEALGGMSSGGL